MPGDAGPMSDTLMISVSGIRGHVGTDLTPRLVARYAAALGAWVRSVKAPSPHRPTGRSPVRPSVVLGRDSRTSGPMFARAAAAGLMSVGVDVIDLGIVPTPTVQLAVEHHHAGAGLILTASHNPDRVECAQVRGAGWNLPRRRGRGVWCGTGGDRAATSRLGRGGPGRARILSAITRHLDAILALPLIDVEAIRRRRFQVALDCVRGAGATAILPLLERLGCQVHGINLETDGLFPGPPSRCPRIWES